MSLRKRKIVLEKAHFDIVHGCQLRCVGCPNSTLQPKVQYIEPEDFHRFLQAIDVDGIRLLRLFNFGEPLLHPRLPEVLRQIPRQTWSAETIEISSNGQHHNFPVLEEAFQTRVLTRLNVSCDGDGTPEEYERLRTPSKWPKFITFLETAKALRDEHCPEMVLMTRTICEDPEAQARWRSILEPRGWAPEFRGWLALPEAAQSMKSEPVVPEGICSFMDRGNNIYVDFDGTVVPCCVHPRASVLGNLGEQTYTEIMQSSARARFADQMKADRRGMSICGRCEF